MGIITGAIVWIVILLMFRENKTKLFLIKCFGANPIAPWIITPGITALTSSCAIWFHMYVYTNFTHKRRHLHLDNYNIFVIYNI